MPGSGIYVRAEGTTEIVKPGSPLLDKFPKAQELVENSLDELLRQGCSLHQARELFMTEVDWRLRCSARVLVTIQKRRWRRRADGARARAGIKKFPCS